MTEPTLFATITYKADGTLQVLIDKAGIEPMDGRQLLEAINGSIQTLQDIRRDVLTAATPQDPALHFERKASTTH